MIRSQVCKALIKAGADLGAKDIFGITALDRAEVGGDAEVLFKTLNPKLSTLNPIFF